MAKKLDIASQKMLDDFDTPQPAYQEAEIKIAEITAITMELRMII